MMEERSNKKFTDSEYLLSGMVYCGVCGAKMRYQKWGKRGCKLCCYSLEKNKPYLVRDENCTNEKIWADEVEKAVTEDLLGLSYEISSGEFPETDIKSVLETKKEQCEKKLKRLYKLFAEGEDDTLLSAINEAKEELKKAEEALNSEKAKLIEQTHINEKRKSLKTLPDTWQYMTNSEKRNIVRSLIDKVTVTKDSVKIDYLF